MNPKQNPTAYLAGHSGMVGSAICRRLSRGGYDLVLPESRVDLTDQQATLGLLHSLRPDWVFLAAARVGGIYANSTYSAEFIYTNLMIQNNVIMENYHSGELVNIGTGSDLSIRELALMIKDVVGFEGEIRFRSETPDGTPRKLLDVTRLNALGWKPSIPLREGLSKAYRWYLENESRARK
jgi:nucleoside-diphosphate-sugar epimerase